MNGIKYLLAPLTENIEDVVINLRQTRRIKLPDAIISATALCNGAELLTLDTQLLSIVKAVAICDYHRHQQMTWIKERI